MDLTEGGVGRDVDVVGVAAAGEGGVELLSGLGAGGDCVDDVGGGALRGVGGGGVAELDRLADVARGQMYVASGAAGGGVEAAVEPGGGDDPAVAVLDPVSLAETESAVV